MRFKKISENKKRKKKDVTKGSFGFFQTLTGGDYEKAMNQFNDSVDFGGVTADGGNAVSEDVENKEVHLRDIIKKIDYFLIFGDIRNAHMRSKLSFTEDANDSDEEYSLDLDLLTMSDKEFLEVSDDVFAKTTNFEVLDRLAKLDRSRVTKTQIDILKKEYSKKEIIDEKDVKALIECFDECDDIALGESYKTQKFMRDHNLKAKDCLDIIHQLESKDYYASTKSFNKINLGNELMIFEPKNVTLSDGRYIGDVVIYVKLDVDDTSGGVVSMMSMHDSNNKRQNKLPYKKESLSEESLLEKDGYHFGDLNVAKKAESRYAQTGGRGTGHFGTGFYMISNLNQNTDYYNKRDLWKVDLDKYNLFKPSSEIEAMKLHDALSALNENVDLSSHDYEDIESRLWDIEELEYRNFTKARSDLEDLMIEEGFNEYWINEILRDFDEGTFGLVSQKVKDIIEDKQETREEFYKAIKDLSSIFGKDVSKEAIDAVTSEDQEDSKSTVFMKSLGYEGIDVTDLKHLDNFKYGSVVYDLKPGTYEKVEKMNESVDNQMTIDEFIDKAEVILVDDAENFDINEWEKKVQDEIDEELEENKTLQDYFNECVENLRRIGLIVDDDIKIVEKDKVTSLASVTTYPREDNKFILYVDKDLLKGSEEDILNTLYHELAHYLVTKKAIRNGLLYKGENGEWWISNRFSFDDYKEHQKEWTKMKDYINFRLGTNIQRIAPEIDAVVDKYAKNAKYTIECNNCHNKFYYYRRSHFVDAVKNNTDDNYECPYCKTFGDYTLIEKK